MFFFNLLNFSDFLTRTSSSYIPTVPLLMLLFLSSRIRGHQSYFIIIFFCLSCGLKIQINDRVTILVIICYTWISFAAIWKLNLNTFFIVSIKMNRRKWKVYYLIWQFHWHNKHICGKLFLFLILTWDFLVKHFSPLLLPMIL